MQAAMVPFRPFRSQPCDRAMPSRRPGAPGHQQGRSGCTWAIPVCFSMDFMQSARLRRICRVCGSCRPEGHGRPCGSDSFCVNVLHLFLSVQRQPESQAGAANCGIFATLLQQLMPVVQRKIAQQKALAHDTEKSGKSLGET